MISLNNLSNDELRTLNRQVCDELQRREKQLKATFAPGDRVEFYHQGGIIVGTVTKIGPKRIFVRPDGNGIHSQWRVNPSLLRRSVKPAPQLTGELDYQAHDTTHDRRHDMYEDHDDYEARLKRLDESSDEDEDE